jgi:copper transport protein
MVRAARIVLSSLVVIAVLAAGAGLAAAPAHAHAGLASSVPEEDATVTKSPAEILLTFEEPPDIKLTRVALVDAQGGRVPVSAPESVPGKPDTLRVLVSQTLPKGVYSVNWHVVSATDGHVEDGAYAFGVQVTPPPGSEVQIDLLATSAYANDLGVAGRWLLYVGLVLLVGCASTCLLVFRGRVPAGGVALGRAAVLVAAAGLALMTWSERDLVGAPSLLPLFETPEGQQLLWMWCALAVVAVAAVTVDFVPYRGALWFLGAAGVTAMLVHCIGGHADAPSSYRPLTVLVQWVHMSAIGVWVGGLVWLLLGIRGAEKDARAAAVATFSRVATATLIVVLATGLVRGFREVGSFSALVDTSYGITLLVKLGLVVVLVALGALNHYRWVPALRKKDGAARSFRLNSTGELVLATCVLLTTAILTGLAPAATASQEKTAATGSAPAPAAVRVAAAHVPVPPVGRELSGTGGWSGVSGYHRGRVDLR